ncbi:MAG: glycosyltransferase family 2 protein [Prevotella sp.]|nr:glycosyltransferase family 2 protein [Prevotella sp.]
MQINYSFIIPHKNCPDLLQRCVDSIPERDDVQVIVVDDNSDEGKKPALKEHKNMQVILLDASQSKGAGRARNVGLKHAEGKWLLFPDSDDFYTEGFLAVLDKYTDEDIEVLYFNSDCVDSKTLSRMPSRLKKYNKMVEDSIKNADAFFKLRCLHNAPWTKMVKKEFVTKNDIEFEETINGNDMMFSHYVGYLTQKSFIISEKLYVYTTSNNGLSMQKNSIEVWMSRIDHNYKQRQFFKYIQHPEWKSISFFNYYIKYFSDKPILGIKVLWNHLKNLNKFKIDEMKYVVFLEKRRK